MQLICTINAVTTEEQCVTADSAVVLYLNHSNVIGSISNCQGDGVLYIPSHKRNKVSLLQR
jgi:hypothetical protein